MCRATARNPTVRNKVSVTSVTAKRDSKAYSMDVASTIAASTWAPPRRHKDGASATIDTAPPTPASAEPNRAAHSETPKVLNAARIIQ